VTDRIQIIDTCVLINLLASGGIEKILRCAANKSLICSAVEAESLFLRTDDPQKPRELIQLAPLIETNLLTTCRMENAEEEELYVNYAAALDDGEAMSIALALARGGSLATDDRKARRLFTEAVGDPDRLISTSDLVRRWFETEKITPEWLEATLQRIEFRAGYQPSPSDSGFNWWMRSCRRQASDKQLSVESFVQEELY
jgi:predicted nucleic acid-binding protein